MVLVAKQEIGLDLSPAGLIRKLSHFLLVDSTPPPPGVILSSGNGDEQSKYRKRFWFTGILGFISMAISMGYIQDENLLERIRTCKKKWTSEEFGKRDRMTDREDIVEADLLIQDVIKELAETYFPKEDL